MGGVGVLLYFQNPLLDLCLGPPSEPLLANDVVLCAGGDEASCAGAPCAGVEPGTRAGSRLVAVLGLARRLIGKPDDVVELGVALATQPIEVLFGSPVPGLDALGACMSVLVAMLFLGDTVIRFSPCPPSPSSGGSGASPCNVGLSPLIVWFVPQPSKKGRGGLRVELSAGRWEFVAGGEIEVGGARRGGSCPLSAAAVLRDGEGCDGRCEAALPAYMEMGRAFPPAILLVLGEAVLLELVALTADPGAGLAICVARGELNALPAAKEGLPLTAAILLLGRCC